MGPSAPQRRPLGLRLLLLAWGLLLVAGCTAAPGGGVARSGSTGRHVASPSAGSTAVSPTPTSQPASWRVVALGDSVTSGGPCGCTTFPSLYARDLAQARGVATTVTNLGQDGLDSGGLLHELRTPGWPGSAAVRGADVVLVTIGANDFTVEHDDVTSGHCLGDVGAECVRDQLDAMRRNVAAILADVHRLRGGRPTTVLVTGYWNVFEDGAVARESFPAAGVRATRELTNLANAAIRQATAAAGATYVDLTAPFTGPVSRGDTTTLLGADGDHPNQRGQALIAQRLLAAGLPGLTPG